jgi:hypothetical protein
MYGTLLKVLTLYLWLLEVYNTLSDNTSKYVQHEGEDEDSGGFFYI